jgi:hypothetical protein
MDKLKNNLFVDLASRQAMPFHRGSGFATLKSYVVLKSTYFFHANAMLSQTVF